MSDDRVGVVVRIVLDSLGVLIAEVWFDGKGRRGILCKCPNSQVTGYREIGGKVYWE